MTTNHNYNTPAEGTVDWHIPMNENFSNLDRDIEIRDTDAKKSNYDPQSGAKYFALDTNKVYIGDGTSWTHVGTIGKLPGDVYVSDTEPDNASQGDIWIDTN